MGKWLHQLLRRDLWARQVQAGIVVGGKVILVIEEVLNLLGRGIVIPVSIEVQLRYVAQRSGVDL